MTDNIHTDVENTVPNFYRYTHSYMSFSYQLLNSLSLKHAHMFYIDYITV